MEFHEKQEIPYTGSWEDYARYLQEILKTPLGRLRSFYFSEQDSMALSPTFMNAILNSCIRHPSYFFVWKSESGTGRKVFCWDTISTLSSLQQDFLSFLNTECASNAMLPELSGVMRPTERQVCRYLYYYIQYYSKTGSVKIMLNAELKLYLNLTAIVQHVGGLLNKHFIEKEAPEGVEFISQ
jgi:hypothetical protein